MPVLNPRDILYEDVYQRQLVTNGSRYKEFERLSTEVILHMVHTFYLSEARLHRNIQKQGLTLPGLNVLCLLRSHGEEGCPLSQLSRLLLVSRANVTGLVDHLVRKRYVARSAHKTDRRVVLARITKTGEAWLDRFLPAHYRLVRGMLAGLSLVDKETLIRLLTKARRSIRAAKATV